MARKRVNTHARAAIQIRQTTRYFGIWLQVVSVWRISSAASAADRRIYSKYFHNELCAALHQHHTKKPQPPPPSTTVKSPFHSHLASALGSQLVRFRSGDGFAFFATQRRGAMLCYKSMLLSVSRIGPLLSPCARLAKHRHPNK